MKNKARGEEFGARRPLWLIISRLCFFLFTSVLSAAPELTVRQQQANRYGKQKATLPFTVQ